MPFATNQGVRIYYRLEGEADRPALVLLNSIGVDLGLYDAVAPLLVGRFRLLRMDTRGHGASDAPPGDYRLDDLARDVLAVMDAAGIDRATICGTSLGGMIGMALAPMAPGRVEALVLACTSPAMDREAWVARIAAVKAGGMAAVADMAIGRFFSEDFRRRRPEVVESVRTGLLTTSPEGYAGCGAAIRDMDLLGRLPEITAPVLVIAGEKDQSTPFEGHGEKIVAAVPHAQVKILPAAHLPSLETPQAFAQAVTVFLAPPSPEIGAANETLFEAGLVNRRAVLGDEWVDRSLAGRTDFNTDYQAMITRYAWNEIWGRPGLDHRTRRLLVVAICASLARWEEFALHVRAGLSRDGFSKEELKETLMQMAIYAGVPAANTAFAEAAKIIAELEG